MSGLAYGLHCLRAICDLLSTIDVQSEVLSNKNEIKFPNLFQMGWSLLKSDHIFHTALTEKYGNMFLQVLCYKVRICLLWEINRNCISVEIFVYNNYYFYACCCPNLLLEHLLYLKSSNVTSDHLPDLPWLLKLKESKGIVWSLGYFVLGPVSI